MHLPAMPRLPSPSCLCTCLCWWALLIRDLPSPGAASGSALPFPLPVSLPHQRCNPTYITRLFTSTFPPSLPYRRLPHRLSTDATTRPPLRCRYYLQAIVSRRAVKKAFTTPPAVDGTIRSFYTPFHCLPDVSPPPAAVAVSPLYLPPLLTRHCPWAPTAENTSMVLYLSTFTRGLNAGENPRTARRYTHHYHAFRLQAMRDGGGATYRFTRDW